MKKDAPQFSTDAPLSSVKEDRFDRAPFAQRIATTIANRSDTSSLIIALYGPWGDGKTTTLRFLTEALNESEDIVTIPFNPWRVQGEEALLESFFSTLAEGLSVKLKTQAEHVGILLKKYSFLLKPIPAAGGGVSSAIEGVGAALSSVSLEQLRSRIGEALKSSQKRLVIIIDDIDRLEKTEIQALFRLVKLTGDFENVVYVLAFDETMVASAIGERFATRPDDHLAAGQNFLEKIVQVGLHLPAITRDSLRNYTYESLNRVLEESKIVLTQDKANALARNIELGILPRMHTPRMANRYGNAIRFSLGLMRGELDSSDLILLEGLRTFYPQVYGFAKHNKDILLSSDRKSKDMSCEALIKSYSPGLSTKELDAVCTLMITLFPRMGTTGYGSDWENKWSDDKRICSDSYFDRYFSYAIKADDVSDVAFEKFLESTKRADATAEAVRAEYESILSEKNAGKLIQKLRAVENELAVPIAHKIALAVAANAKFYTNNETAFSFFSTPLLQACILNRKLLQRFDPEYRADACEKIIVASGTLRFAAESIRWFSSGKDDKTPALTEAEEGSMRHFGANYLLTQLEALEEFLFEANPKDAAPILGVISWGLGAEPARNYVMSQLSSSKGRLEPFLVSFLPTAWSMETGIPHTGQIRRETYDSICRLADAEYVRSVLKETFGSELDQPVYYGADDFSPYRKIAHQFMHIDMQVNKAAVKAGDSAEDDQTSQAPAQDGEDVTQSVHEEAMEEVDPI